VHSHVSEFELQVGRCCKMGGNHARCGAIAATIHVQCVRGRKATKRLGTMWRYFGRAASKTLKSLGLEQELDGDVTPSEG